MGDQGSCFGWLQRMVFGRRRTQVAHPINAKILEIERMQSQQFKAQRKADARQARINRRERVARTICCLPMRDS